MNNRKRKKQDLKRKEISYIGVLKVPHDHMQKANEIADSLNKLNSNGEWIIISDNYECYITPLYSPKTSRIRTVTKIIKNNEKNIR